MMMDVLQMAMNLLGHDWTRFEDFPKKQTQKLINVELRHALKSVTQLQFLQLQSLL